LIFIPALLRLTLFLPYLLISFPHIIPPFSVYISLSHSISFFTHKKLYGRNEKFRCIEKLNSPSLRIPRPGYWKENEKLKKKPGEPSLLKDR
jgi:hypothetical protein